MKGLFLLFLSYLLINLFNTLKKLLLFTIVLFFLMVGFSGKHLEVSDFKNERTNVQNKHFN